MITLRSASWFGKTLISVRFGSSKNVQLIDPSADWLPIKGKESAKKPDRVRLEANKQYSYCACGLSARDPWCDDVCKTYGFTELRKIDFTVDKTDEYSLCRCKQTNKRPLCDGTHKFISQRPRDIDATGHFVVDENTAVYEGVAKQLGYRSKNGFQ